jgi:alpha-L-fucosidase
LTCIICGNGSDVAKSFLIMNCISQLSHAAYALWLGHWLLMQPAVALAAAPKNLALNKPATSSSIENDEHNAARANDGDPSTCWRADDEPESGPEWWQVDLGAEFDLSACNIRWPYDGKRYRYKVEGSTDQKSWTILSDQTKSDAVSQVHKLKLHGTGPIRYVRITITGLDEGCWASISEVKLLGSEHATGGSR